MQYNVQQTNHAKNDVFFQIYLKTRKADNCLDN